MSWQNIKLISIIWEISIIHELKESALFLFGVCSIMLSDSEPSSGKNEHFYWTYIGVVQLFKGITLQSVLQLQRSISHLNKKVNY